LTVFEAVFNGGIGKTGKKTSKQHFFFHFFRGFGGRNLRPKQGVQNVKKTGTKHAKKHEIRAFFCCFRGVWGSKKVLKTGQNGVWQVETQNLHFFYTFFTFFSLF